MNLILISFFIILVIGIVVCLHNYDQGGVLFHHLMLNCLYDLLFDCRILRVSVSRGWLFLACISGVWRNGRFRCLCFFRPGISNSTSYYYIQIFIQIFIKIYTHIYTLIPIYNIKLTRPLPFLPPHDKTLPNKYPYPNTHQTAYPMA